MLAKPDNRMDRLEAYTRVTLQMDKRSAAADRLTYHAADERYVMTGLPSAPASIISTTAATATTPQSCRQSNGRTLTFSKATETINVDGNAERRTETRNSPCPASTVALNRDGSPSAPLVSTLRTQALTKSYGGRTVVRGVSLQVASGEIVGLLGPERRRQDHHLLHDGRPRPRPTPDASSWTATTSPTTRCTSAPARDRLSSAGAVDLPRADRRTEHPRDPGNARSRRRDPDERGSRAARRAEPDAAGDSPAYTLSGGERRRAEITRALVMSPSSSCSTSRLRASIRSP